MEEQIQSQTFASIQTLKPSLSLEEIEQENISGEREAKMERECRQTLEQRTMQSSCLMLIEMIP